MAKFIKTTLFTGTEAPQPGQWIKTEMGQRGQYLGRTDSGAIVVRWQNVGKFAKRDALNNKHLRNFAKVYGSK
jgi:hypothetical protein